MHIFEELRVLNDFHLKQIESIAEKGVKEKQSFELIQLSKEQAFDIFSDNRLKL